MKTLVLIALIGLFPYRTIAQGIEFEHGSWQDVLAKAVQLNKPVFVDIYTTWCGPCRQMSNTVFPLQEVGDFYNEHFINYKLDAEKGEGIKLSEDFEVTGYPTYVFIQPDGQMFYRSVGSMPVKHFLSLGQQALLDYNVPDGYLMLRKQYENNRKQIQAVQAYLEKRIEMNLTNSELLDEYLQLLSPEQQDSDSILDLLRWDKNSIKSGSTAYTILTRNRDRIKELGAKYIHDFDYVIHMQTFGILHKAARNRDEQLIKEAIDHAKQYIGEEYKKTDESYYMDYYETVGDLPKYFEIASGLAENQLMQVSVEEIKKKDKIYFDQWNTPENLKNFKEMDPDDYRIMIKNLQMHESYNYALELNAVAWNCFLKMTDTESLLKALGWSKRSLEFTGNSVGAFLDTYANLLHKLGRTEEAIPWEEMAIEKGLLDEEDISSYKVALEKMKKGEPTWEPAP